MRPHVRVFPLVLVFVVAMIAVASIPVDQNERACAELARNPKPVDRSSLDRGRAPDCSEPVWQPWILRFMAEGY